MDTLTACTIHSINHCTICLAPVAPSLTGFARVTVTCSTCGTTVVIGRQAYVTPWDTPNQNAAACAWHAI